MIQTCYFLFHAVGIDFKIKTIELGGKRIKLQIWSVIFVTVTCYNSTQLLDLVTVLWIRLDVVQLPVLCCFSVTFVTMEGCSCGNWNFRS